MVDYSKWDRMDFGSDSDNDDDDDGDQQGPRVTSLDQPGKVTIGADGSLEIGKSDLPRQPPRTQSLATSTSSSSKSKSKSKQKGIPTVSGSVSGDVVDISSSQTRSSQLTQLTHNGGEHHCIANAIKLPVYWSQDRYTVTLRLGIPSELYPTRGIRVRVKGALSYRDRFSAVGSGNNGSVDIVSSSLSSSNDNNNDHEETETVLLSGKIPRPIHLNQGEDEIDFEIEDNNTIIVGTEKGTVSSKECMITKLVTIILPKAVPMAGMVLWWDCPLVGYPQIDVSAIGERKTNNPLSSHGQTKEEGGDKGKGAGQNNKDKKKKKEAFQEAWDEAHQMFREKMKLKEKQSIEINE